MQPKPHLQPAPSRQLHFPHSAPPAPARTVEIAPGILWARLALPFLLDHVNIYFVDDGYAKSDDEALGGECELADPRGAVAAMVTPSLAYRVPGGLAAGLSEVIRPQSGMIVLHPSWQPRGERRYDGPAQRVSIEFDLAVPAQS